MTINISEIVSNKLKQMEEERVIEKQIESSIESTITKAVKDACEDYTFERDIKKMISSEVSEVAKNIGFTGYNQFIADTLKELINSTLREDVKNKIVSSFDTLFVQKVEKIKLSEIVKRYEELMQNLDYDEKLEADDGHFYVSFDEDSSDNLFTYWTFTFALKSQSRSVYSFRYSSGSDDNKLVLRIYKYKDKDYDISGIKYEGKDLSKLDEIGTMSDFECFLASLYFNKTKIDFDINEDDVDTYLGIDD